MGWACVVRRAVWSVGWFESNPVFFLFSFYFFHPFFQGGRGRARPRGDVTSGVGEHPTGRLAEPRLAGEASDRGSRAPFELE